METLVNRYDRTDLGQYKLYMYDKIDKKTGELISQGFVYNTKTFSFSANAQSNLLGVYSAKELLTYPFDWNVKDDSETYAIADADEMSAFFMTALTTKKAHQDSGTALKTQVRNAVDLAAVKLIVDNR